MKAISLVPALLVLAFASGNALAAGDPVKGQSKAAYCYGCHQISGWRNAYPPYAVPKLGGQHPDYIVAALKGYQSGERKHPTMHAVAASLTEEDIANLAAYYGASAAKAAANPEGTPEPKAAAKSDAGKDANKAKSK